MRPGLDVTDGKYFAKDYIGYGGHFGMDVKPGWLGWVKDDIALQFEAGDGIVALPRTPRSDRPWRAISARPALRQYNETTGAAAGAAGAAAIRVTTVNEAGGSLGYQHWWLDNLRSNITGGWEYIDIPAALISKSTTFNKEL